MAQRRYYPRRVLEVDTDLISHTDVEGSSETIKRTM
jgi:hypothetical protein